MSFIENLEEALTMQQVADLATKVTVMSLEGPSKGKYLILTLAAMGNVSWDFEPDFMMKGKIKRDILPKIMDKIGTAKFVKEKDIEREAGLGI